MNFWTYGFCAVCFLVLFDPFISVWIGNKFIMNFPTECAIVCSFLITGLQETVGTHRAAYGLFYKGRYRPIFSVILNIFFSILFVKIFPKTYGVVAVLLGTIISNITVSWWFDAYLVYKYAFQKKPWRFYRGFWLRFIFTMIIGIILRIFSEKLPVDGWMLVIIDGVVVTLIYNIVFVGLFHKREEYIYLKNSILRIL